MLTGPAALRMRPAPRRSNRILEAERYPGRPIECGGGFYSGSWMGSGESGVEPFTRSMEWTDPFLHNRLNEASHPRISKCRVTPLGKSRHPGGPDCLFGRCMEQCYSDGLSRQSGQFRKLEPLLYTCQLGSYANVYFYFPGKFKDLQGTVADFST
jgi:hypothetical protein